MEVTISKRKAMIRKEDIIFSSNIREEA